MMMKFRRVLVDGINIALVLITLTISACSLRLMYDYLDWILPWYIDDYVTLTDQQEKLFDRATLQFLDWHRSVELPRYVQFFSELKDAQQAPMTQEQVLLFFDEAGELWTTLLEESLPDLLILARQLNDSQIKEIDRALQNDIEELREKYGKRTDEEQRRFWEERLAENLDDWLGDVKPVQLELLRQWTETRINTTSDWLAYRNDWRDRFIELLHMRDQEDFAIDMRDFLLKPQNSYSAPYLQAIEKNRLKFAKLIADISSTLTAEQRKYLQKELAEIIFDLNDLSEQRG